MDMLPAAQKILAGLGIHLDVAAFLAVFGLIFARLAMAINLAPFLGGQSVPGQIKVGMAAMLAALLYPGLIPAGEPPNLTSVLFIALLIKEVLIGATLGLATQFVFYSVQMAGIIIDQQRGANQLAFMAPQLPGNVSILGLVKFQAALVLFLVLDGHLLFLRTLHSSFVALPVLTFPHFTAGLAEVLLLMARISADSIRIGLELSAPVLIALFLVDVAFGCISKVAPQIKVHTESQPGKALFGTLMLLFAIGLIFDQLKIHMGEMLHQVAELIQGLR